MLAGSAFNHTTSPSNFNQGSAFISVLDAAGASLLYSSLFGGNGSPAGNEHGTFGSDVTVDSSGNFYLAGTTGSNQMPVTPGAFQTTYYGNPNPGFGTSTRGFVAKFNPVSSGAVMFYATYLGGFDKTVVSYQDVISGIAADAAGNAYISGNAAYDFPATAGANNSTACPGANSCENRGFLAKLNPTGSGLVWATFVGTVTDPTLSSANTISPPRLDAAGNIYVSGVAGNNTEYPLVNPLQLANGFSGVYVTMYDPTGSTMIFSTVIYDPTGNGQIFSSGVDADSQGNVYVAGYTARTAMPVTTGAFQTANAGNFDGFIAKVQVLSPPPAIKTGGVVSSASFQAVIAPNSWISLFGSNLSSETDTWTNAVINGVLPTSLDGVKVSVGGQPAYVAYVSPGLINALAPNVGSGSVSVTITNSSGTSSPVTAAVQTSEPAFFQWGTYAVATRVDYSLAVKNGTFSEPTVPAKPGDTIILWGTGFGPTTPSTPTGVVVPGDTTYNTSSTVTVTVGGVAATVDGAALTAGDVGLYQVAIQIPTGLADGDYPVVATVAGAQSPSSTLITVQN